MNLIIRQCQIFKSGKDWQLLGNKGVMPHSSFENKQFRLQNSPPVRQPCVAQELEKKKEDDDRRWQQATTAQEIRVFPSNDKDGTVCFSDITLISFRVALLSSTLRLLVCVPVS